MDGPSNINFSLLIFFNVKEKKQNCSIDFSEIVEICLFSYTRHDDSIWMFTD
jgi:hypothetical protein